MHFPKLIALKLGLDILFLAISGVAVELLRSMLCQELDKVLDISPSFVLLWSLRVGRVEVNGRESMNDELRGNVIGCGIKLSDGDSSLFFECISEFIPSRGKFLAVTTPWSVWISEDISKPR